MSTDASSSTVSYVLLKPDALHQELLPHIRKELQEAGLSVQMERKLVLSEDDIKVIWLRARSALHPLSVRLQSLYLADQESLLIEVHGVDAIAATDLIKKRVRRAFSRGMFANVLHTPDTTSEAVRQLGYLLAEPSQDRSEFVPAVEPPPFPWVDFGQLGYTPEQVADLANEVWADVAESSFQLLSQPPLRVGEPECEIHLCDDHVNSLDSAVASLCLAVPGMKVPTALHICIQVDANGIAPVVACSRDELNALIRNFEKFGLPEYKVFHLSG